MPDSLATSDRLGDLLPLRSLGNTGRFVTMLGTGGAHVGRTDSESEARAIIETALEGGVRFFDTAHAYQNGRSEERYGKYLTPQYRDLVFLMTKSTAKDAKTASAHLEESLTRMRTDYLDLALTYALINFIGTVAVLKFMQYGDLGWAGDVEDDSDV